MDRVAIITDSVACLPRDLADRNKIHVVPAGNIYFKGKMYRDWLELSHAEVYHMLRSNPGEFFTGSTTPLDFLNVYRELSRDADHVIYISLSSKFSTLYNMACAARDIAREQLPGTQIEVVDSRTATAAQGFIALAAARAAGNGTNFDDIIKTIDHVKEKVDLYYILHTVRYVYRTGRVSKTVAGVGSWLKVKPLITVRNGSAQVISLQRDKSKSIEQLRTIARQKFAAQPVHLAVLHADARSEAEQLMRDMTAEFNCVEAWISEFSPLMTYATGRGVIGVAFYVGN
jgi:DegV family protein with EDD domain